MIYLKGIKKSFGNLEVLRGIDLHVGKGEIVSIVGPSGAGKTTLLQIMGTLDRADSGSVMLDGVDVNSLSGRELSRFRNRKIGFVFQSHQLLNEFTALENVMIPAHIAKTDSSDAKTPARRTARFRGTVATQPPQAARDVGRRAATSGSGARAGQQPHHNPGR